MFTLSKVGLDDICSHFQKWHQMYVHFLKVELDVYTFKSGIRCLFSLSKIAFDVCSYFQKWHPKVAFTLSKMVSYICPHFQKWHLMLEVG